MGQMADAGAVGCRRPRNWMPICSAGPVRAGVFRSASRFGQAVAKSPLYLKGGDVAGPAVRRRTSRCFAKRRVADHDVVGPRAQYFYERFFAVLLCILFYFFVLSVLCFFLFFSSFFFVLFCSF
jgi:hypothetical protein